MIHEKPIIYKPGVYNTPGVYNGAGGIYKGRGVYNDGFDKLKVWELDIPNLILSNHTLDGMPVTFSNNNVQKLDDNKKLRIWNGNRFRIGYLNLQDNSRLIKEAGVVIEHTAGNYSYVGPCKCYHRVSYDMTPNAAWFGKPYTSNKEWDWKVGDYFPGTNFPSDPLPIGYYGRQNIPGISLPITLIVKMEDTIKVFYNDILIAERENDVLQCLENYSNKDWFIFDMSSGDITISKFWFKYE